MTRSGAGEEFAALAGSPGRRWTDSIDPANAPLIAELLAERLDPAERNQSTDPTLIAAAARLAHGTEGRRLVEASLLRCRDDELGARLARLLAAR